MDVIFILQSGIYVRSADATKFEKNRQAEKSFKHSLQ